MRIPLKSADSFNFKRTGKATVLKKKANWTESVARTSEDVFVVFCKTTNLEFKTNKKLLFYYTLRKPTCGLKKNGGIIIHLVSFKRIRCFLSVEGRINWNLIFIGQNKTYLICSFESVTWTFLLFGISRLCVALCFDFCVCLFLLQNVFLKLIGPSCQHR